MSRRFTDTSFDARDRDVERVAAGHDRACGATNVRRTAEPAVDFLCALAGGGRALDFAIGGGRIALPLRARGLDVHGIEPSQRTIGRMVAKPGGDGVPMTVGDVARSAADGVFGLAYLVDNAITDLLTQNEQVDCFRNAAAHLGPGGYFVIEGYVPPLQRLLPGESRLTFKAGPDHAGYDEYDVARQTQASHRVRIEDGRLETYDSLHRYAWPAECDLMARLAGMTLHERWAGWRWEPFTSEARSHVSVWRKLD